MERWTTNGKRLILCSLLMGFSMVYANGGTAHATASSVKLDITSKVCPVDVVQDGGSETVQILAPECKTILPNLLTVVPDASRVSRPALPFAGPSGPATQIVAQPTPERSLGPIASTEQAASARQPGLMVAAAAASGISIVIVTALLVVDIIVFEFSYSTRLGHWMRTLLSRH